MWHFILTPLGIFVMCHTVRLCLNIIYKSVVCLRKKNTPFLFKAFLFDKTFIHTTFVFSLFPFSFSGFPNFLSFIRVQYAQSVQKFCHLVENTCFQHTLSILGNIVIVVSNILGPLAAESSTLSVNFGISLLFPTCLCWKMQNKEREVRKILLEMFGLCNYFMIFSFYIFCLFSP